MQITLENIDKDGWGNNVEGINLDMDSIGLGVTDAFFASLSMIIVSEVCAIGFIVFSASVIYTIAF